MTLPIGVVAAVGSTVIRALASTWRFRYADSKHLDAAKRHSPKIIFAFWHGRLLPLLLAHRNESIHVLASEHRDGEILGQTIRHLGYGLARGSSTRGGSRAIREMTRVMKNGYDVGLTVDGPKGPIHVVKPGPIQIAKLTGAAIIPLTSSSRRRKVFSSWDRFELPMPFTEVLVTYGDPVTVPSDADTATIEEKRLHLENILNSITRESDLAIHG